MATAALIARGSSPRIGLSRFALARPAAQIARGAPAECPTTTTRERSSGYRFDRERRWSTAEPTSVNVAGQPPPLSLRRYSMFQVAIPIFGSSLATGARLGRDRKSVV